MHRPSIGQSGRQIDLQVNAFKVKNFTNGKVYHYDVSINNEETLPSYKRRELWQEVEKISPLKDIPCAYDGIKNLYLLKQIPEPIQIEVNQPGKRDKAKIVIKLVGEINLYELAQLFGNRNADITSNVLDAIVALNVMIRHRASIQYANKGASIYPTPLQNEKTFRLSGGIEMWRGYFSSLRLAPESLVLNMNATVMPFIQQGNLLDICAAILEKREGARQLLRDGITDRESIQLGRILKNAKVSIDRLNVPNPHISHKVRSLSRLSAEKFTFEMDDGKKTNVADHMRRTYNVNIQGRNLPCIQVSKKAYYPIELCTIQMGNKFSKKLTPKQVADVLKFTTQKPVERLQTIRDGLRRLNYSSCKTIRAWDFQLDPTPMTVKGRLLEPPGLTFGSPNGTKVVKPQDATWRYERGTSFNEPKQIANWIVLVFQNPKIYPVARVNESIKMLVQACRNTGIKVSDTNPQIYHVNPRDVPTPEDLMGFIKSKCSKKPNFIVTYVPTRTSSIYNNIKAFGDVLAGIPTQNLVIQKTDKAKPPYYANVALKINVKLGGINFKLDRSLPGCQSNDRVMVLGADVTHPGPGSTKPSVAGVVGSHEGTNSKYSARVRVQSSRQEFIDDLSQMVQELIQVYEQKGKGKPNRIFFYRDGVSEGMFDETLSREVPAIKKAFKSLDPNYNPLLTFIICGKRHHYRFFPVRDGDRNGNAPAGTVLDVGITHPIEYDWYMLSHNGLLGTSRPAHYSVLFDENKLSADNLQALTYYLCYLYPRSTRSVSIASPAYFAHHVCTRARAHLGMGDEDETASEFTSTSAEQQRLLHESIQKLKPVHKDVTDNMYFM